MEQTKRQAFEFVKSDNLEALRHRLALYPVDEWMHWRNFAGQTLLQLAEYVAACFVIGATNCLGYLRERLRCPGSFGSLDATTARQPVAYGRITRGPITTETVEPATRSPIARETFEPVAREPINRQPIAREPVVKPAARRPVVRETIVKPVVASVVEPVVEPMVGRRAQKVIQPSILERVVEVPSVQETRVVVEVPERHSHTITAEFPNVRIHEEIRLNEVPVHHLEQVLDVTAVPQITYHEEPRIILREEITPLPKQIYRESEEIVAVPMEPPTVGTMRAVVQPKVKVTPYYIRGEPQVVTKEETVSYEFPFSLLREEVVLRSEVQKVFTPKTVDAPEERILEVPQERVEYRTVDVPEIITHRKVKYVPTFPMLTSPWPREPIVGESVVVEPFAGESALGRGLSPEGHDGDGLHEELGAELRRLREQNRLLAEEGTLMEERLRRYQREADELAEELSKERRAQRELGTRLEMDPKAFVVSSFP